MELLDPRRVHSVVADLWKQWNKVGDADENERLAMEWGISKFVEWVRNNGIMVNRKEMVEPPKE